MALNIDNLAIEVTRKCNMNCEHCLRGAAQRKNISNNHIYKLLQIVDNVSTLTITGGEPTLNMEALEQIRTCIIYGNADVNSFYMVTNGKAINVDDLAEWSYNMLNCCSDNEMSSVGFSFDTFHTQTFNWKQVEKQQRNFDRLKEKLEYEYGIYESPCGGDFVHKHSDNSWGYDSLLQEGRAKDFGSRKNNKSIFEIEDYDGAIESVYVSENELYLTCSGWIVAGCNWSYNSMDSRKDLQICHIDNIYSGDDLLEAIKNYNKKAEKVVMA